MFYLENYFSSLSKTWDLSEEFSSCFEWIFIFMRFFEFQGIFHICTLSFLTWLVSFCRISISLSRILLFLVATYGGGLPLAAVNEMMMTSLHSQLSSFFCCFYTNIVTRRNPEDSDSSLFRIVYTQIYIMSQHLFIFDITGSRQLRSSTHSELFFLSCWCLLKYEYDMKISCSPIDFYEMEYQSMWVYTVDIFYLVLHCVFEWMRKFRHVMNKIFQWHSFRITGWDNWNFFNCAEMIMKIISIRATDFVDNRMQQGCN